MMKGKVSSCVVMLIVLFLGSVWSTGMCGASKEMTYVSGSFVHLEGGSGLPCFDDGAGEVISEINGGSPGACLEAIDYDGDGDMDYLEGSNQFVFMVTNINGHFEKTMLHNWFFYPDPDSGYVNTLVYGDIASVDLNNDGQQDFITGGNQGRIMLFINNNSQQGMPCFTNFSLVKFGQAAYGIGAADFDGDGWMDFAVSHATSPLRYSTITLFYNQGNLTFYQKDVYRLDDNYIHTLDVGDFDGDGDVDLLFTKTVYKWHGDLPLNVIGVYCLLENEGDETYGSERVIAERGRDLSFWIGPRFYFIIQISMRHFFGFDRINPHVTSADYDGDGDLDFLVGDNSGMVEFFLNDGWGNFESEGVIHRYGFLSWGLASADFDGDGDIDFIVAALIAFNDYDKGYVWLKRNQRVSSPEYNQVNGTTFVSIDPLSSVFPNSLQTITYALAQHILHKTCLYGSWFLK